MLRLALLLLFALDDPPAPAKIVRFEAPKYGLATVLPAGWPIAAREEDDRIFVALIPQADPDRPGVAACELGLAPETLDDYKTRIDANGRRSGPNRTLVRNEVVAAGKGEDGRTRPRLETTWEFRTPGGELWREETVRIVSHRQMYTFTLNVDDRTYPMARPAFDALVAATTYAPPNTGADRVGPAANRWVQREFRFAIDLPEGWAPVLAPSEVALFFANGPAHGIWSDNVLVLARSHGPLDLDALARDLPDQLRREEPNCEVLSCRVIQQGETPALETVVRTTRGPFSMTVLERRFRAGRFDYEAKYTVESDRFDALAPALRRSLESFGEVPGAVPEGLSRPA